MVQESFQEAHVPNKDVSDIKVYLFYVLFSLELETDFYILCSWKEVVRIGLVLTTVFHNTVIN